VSKALPDESQEDRMGKIGVNVGEDFPAEDVSKRDDQSGERSEHEHDCDHEEWRRRRDEHRARARAFRDDIRRAAHKHFGRHPYTAHNVFVLRVLLGVSVLALLTALIPHLVLLGMLLTCAAFFAMALARHHHHYDVPHGDAGV